MRRMAQRATTFRQQLPFWDRKRAKKMEARKPRRDQAEEGLCRHRRGAAGALAVYRRRKMKLQMGVSFSAVSICFSLIHAGGGSGRWIFLEGGDN